MKITQSQVGDILILNLSGELTIETAHHARDEIFQAIGMKPYKLVLNCHELDYMSSAGIQVLYQSWDLAIHEKIEFALCSLNSHVDRVLKLINAQEDMMIYDDVASVINSH